jgi:hypothetical protein
MLSFGFGVAIYLKKFLPVVPMAHFVQPSFFYLCAYDFLGCVHGSVKMYLLLTGSHFGYLSALSFPGMFECPGVHCILSSNVVN